MELHHLLGHVSLKAAHNLVVHGCMTDIKLTDNLVDDPCNICIHLKITHHMVPWQAEHAEDPEHMGVESYGDHINADI